jgi:hypothetical protein
MVDYFTRPQPFQADVVVDISGVSIVSQLLDCRNRKSTSGYRHRTGSSRYRPPRTSMNAARGSRDRTAPAAAS